MIAMQYAFTLPADYDMGIIRRRIADNGHRLEDFPGLAFKAWLHAARGDASLPSRDNLYAPLYLWREVEGMQRFLCGDGFAALVEAFGRPAVRTWSVWRAALGADPRAAVCASRELVDIPSSASLSSLRDGEAALADRDRADGALAAVSAFEPDGWSLLRFRLWGRARADLAQCGRQLYAVGHVSMSTRACASSR